MASLRFILPQLASPADEAPQGERWIHEIKYDGYRCQVLLEPGRIRVLTRNGYDWSDRYPSIIRAASDLRCRTAIIDGEAIVQDSSGASDFDALNTAMHWRPESIILYAFDLMQLDGIDFRERALSDRRAILRALLRNDHESRIQFSEEFVGDGAALFKACADRGLEGIVSKYRYFFAEIERLTVSWETFKASRHSDAKWCQPELMVRVKHLAGSKTLRHATVRELVN